MEFVRASTMTRSDGNLAATARASVGTIARWHGPIIETELFDINLERAGHFIVVTARGFWTPADVARYNGELEPLFKASRQRFGCCRILVDMQKISVQSTEVAQHFAADHKAFDKPGDTIALVVNSSLLKMQVNRVCADDLVATFARTDEAGSWLSGETDAGRLPSQYLVR